MKAIRRSIKGERHDSRPNHISITPKSATAIQPPKKVIKALYDYDPDPNNPNELGFHKGDFFHVISRENDEDWYEACNPLIPSARGLVPVSYFEVIGKTERQSTGSNPPTHLPISAPSTAGLSGGFKSPELPGHLRNYSQSQRGAMVYGIVIYDFNAERPDELDAKAGEAIIVIAQSNPEWFVAKPIGRLGGPGLIPVSFIEIRDMSSGRAVDDPYKAVQAAGVPRVEEWKKLAADYKNSSITLGKFEAGNSTDSFMRGSERVSSGNKPNGISVARLAPIKASIPRYCFENDKYWYIVECMMEDGTHWELSRFYQDFYDFQIALLQEFPNEANADSGNNRLLPYMPGPVTYVTDAISNGRRESLDIYIKQLLALPPYISKCHLVRQLFSPRDGDFELDPKTMDQDYRLSRGSHQSLTRQDTMSRESSDNHLNGSGYGQNGGRIAGSTASHHGNANLLKARVPLTKASDLGTLNQPAVSTGALKIKVWFEDDCIAIRVPSETNYSQLRDKLHERLKVKEEILIQYKDEPSGGYAEMLSDNDLDVALERNPKLQLYVGFA